MIVLIATLIVSAAIVHHSVSVFSLRNEIKTLNSLYSQEEPSQGPKIELRKRTKKAARFSDGSKKWLADKEKRYKEVS